MPTTAENLEAMYRYILRLETDLSASLTRERTLWVTCKMALGHIRAGKLDMATQLLADAALIDEDSGKPMPLDMEEEA